MKVNIGNKNFNIIPPLINCVAQFFFVICFSVGLPIYFRPFYYAHIEPLQLVEKSGFSREQIIEAYNAMLDFLVFPGKEFSTGIMNFSENGVSHFVDCKWLFGLNGFVLLISIIILLTMYVLYKTKRVQTLRFKKHSSSFYVGIFCVVVPLVIGGIAAVDFTKFFEVFHHVLFPGKTNWMFNPYTDEIIKVLPQEFFMNCAILIGASVFILSSSFIFIDCIRVKRKTY